MDEFDFRKFMAQKYPQYRDVGYFYKQMLAETLRPGMSILSAGCGAGFYVPEYFDQSKYFIVGVDAQKNLLVDNEFLENIIISDLTDLPLSENSFDLVVSEWVFEHIAEPEKVLRQFSRILRPGGRVVFMTSHLWSPIMLASKLLPTAIHRTIRKQLLSVNDADTFRTYYRMNTQQDLERHFTKAGFINKNLLFASALNYFRFHRVALYAASSVDRLSVSRYGNFLRPHIAGVYESSKERDSSARNADVYQCQDCGTKMVYEFQFLRCSTCNKEYPARIHQPSYVSNIHF